MLADYYSGTCPTCRSTITVPFSRRNLETRRIRIRNTAVPFRRVLPEKKANKIVHGINIALFVIICAIIVTTIVLFATGKIPLATAGSKFELSVKPEASRLLNNIEKVWRSSVERFRLLMKTVDLKKLFNGFSRLFAALVNGLETFFVLSVNKISNLFS